MFAAALSAALWAALAQELPRADDRPLRNDCKLGLSQELGDELARGDALEAGSAQALDAWHRALDLGAQDAGALAPLPAAQGGALRGGECAELAVLRRLAALGAPGWSAWRARFEELARNELARLPPEESALERFVAAQAGTESAQRAGLMLGDLARERGDEQGACGALRRARAQGPLAAPIEAALARRASAPGAPAGPAAARLEPLFALELTAQEAREDWAPERRAGAALAQLDDGTLLWWAAGALRTVDAQGRAERVDLAALSSERGWSWVAPFRDEHSPWTPTLIARGRRALLALGRARGSEGNLFAALDFPAREPPRLAWAWEASGLALGADEATRVLPAGLWEYQPGACQSDGRVYVCARRYAAAPEQRPEVSELAAETWCLCLELSSGALLWQRALGEGADPATRDPARRPEPRGFCTGADPLAVEGGRLGCSTGLGWLALLDLPTGRLLGCWRAGLEAEELGARRLLVPPASIGAGLRWQPAASAWSYRIEPGAALALERADGALRVAGVSDRSWWLRSAEGALRLETRLAGAPGPRSGVALARGERIQALLELGPQLVALASQRALYLFDDRDPARLVERVELPAAASGSAEGSGCLIASPARLACAVGSALAVFHLH
jgi:hypothetical protein